MRKLTAIMCAILVFTTTTIPVYAEDEIYIEPGQNVSENMESENMESENMESENMESENMESENMESENMESENIASENMESVDESEDAGESDETGEPADEYGAAPLAEETYEVSYGPFTLKASEEIIQNTDYNTGTSNTLTITSSKPVTISMAASGSTTTQYKIAVESPDGANITLSGVSIQSGSGCAFEIKASSGPVTVTLDGDNTLQSGSSYAGLQKGNNARLTINGSGSLKATGGEGGGAGIGGGAGGSGSYITIESSTIEATGGTNGGAGIGGGSSSGSGTDIKINGGNITAKGGTSGGAGIGGGSIGSGTGITISGGTVEATGAYGSAGIGGGVGGSGTDITINSGTEITANGGQGGSGIGGGQSGSGTRITINGGKIKAIGGSTSSVGGAGIGGGSSGSGTGITISGSATVYANGGQGGAGIGGGRNGSSENITISGGIVTANGGANGAGIGGGLDGNGTNIEINGSAAVYANCKDENGEDLKTPIAGNGAGIGGGGGNGSNGSKAGDGDNITIKGSGTVQATGAGNGAGIGGGGNGQAYAGNGTNITIDLSGGTVIAEGSTSGYGAGIGGGGAQANSGYSESISISGSGTVEAKGGMNTYMTGAAIGGGGNGGNSKGITISGSVTVKAESGIIGCGTGWGVNGNSGAITIGKDFSGTINAGTIGGGGENSSVTIKGTGTITATVAIGGSGSTVNIEGEDEDFYPWVEAGSITRTNTDEYKICVVFDKNYKSNYGNEITDETTKKVRREHKPDGVVYGDVSLAKRDEAYVLESGKTLTVHTGGKLTTGDKLTLQSGAVLYLEDDATLVKYEDINGYQDEGNTSQVLHEAHSSTTDNKICDICGASIPHQWSKEWDTNDLYHWHNCEAQDCSVLADKSIECEIKVPSQKDGFGRHIFKDYKPIWGGDYLRCEVCGRLVRLDDAPPTLEPIEIYKVDGNGNALAGATFGLYSDADCKNMVDEATSVEVDVNGETKAVASFVGDKIEFDKTYYIREIKAPTGYKKSDDKYKVTVGPDGKVTYGESDTTPSKCMNTKIVIDPIKIYKEDGNGNALEGATFGLYSDADCKNEVDKATSVKVEVDGEIKAVASFDVDKIEVDLENDTIYYIREIKAPTGYTKSDDKYKVTVGPDGKVTYETEPLCKNTKIVIDPIKIYKEDGNGKALAGAVFGLYSDEDCKNTVYEATSVEVNIAGETKAVASFVGDKIEFDKTYYIREITAPTGYTKSDDKYKVTVDSDGKVTYEIDPLCKNTKIVPDPIKIYKEDGNGNALAGATFGLYSDENCNDDDKVDEATSAEVKVDGKTKAVASFAGDKIEIDKTYYIREITAPTGYTKSDDKYKVTVDSNGKVTYETAPLCKNSKIPDPIQIYKVDGGGKALAGAKFRLYSDVSFAETARVGAEVTAAETTIDDETKAVASFTAGIEVGKTYYIKETKAPDGYRASDKVYKAVVDADGKVTYSIVDPEGNVITALKDIPQCINTKIPDPIQIYKVDGGGKALAGAKFRLYSDVSFAETAQVGAEVTAAETRIDDETKAVASFTAGIEPGKTYYIRETKAPDGYRASDEVYKAVVDADGMVAYSIVDSKGIVIKDLDDIPECINTKIPDPIQIYKVDGGGKALAGAKFMLYSDVSFAETARVGEEVTAAETPIGAETKAVASFTAGIEVGKTYYIKETKAPDGYRASDKVYKAVVGADGKVTYSIVDSEGNVITALNGIPECVNTKIIPDPAKIIVEDGETEAPLAGAEFGIYSDEECTEANRIAVGTTKIDTDSASDTHNKAVVSFKTELRRTYYIKETQAPEGYIASEEVYKVVVGIDGKVAYGTVGSEETKETVPVCKNYKIIPGAARIVKEDGETGAPLAGAEFGIYSDEECTEANRIAVGTTAIDTDSASDTYNKAVVSFTTELNRTYYIKEIKAPNGYNVSGVVYKAVVDADGKVTYGTAGSEETKETVPVCKNYAVKITYNPPSITKVEETGDPIVLSPKTGDTGEAVAAGIAILSGIAWIAFLVGVLQKRKRKKELFL